MTKAYRLKKGWYAFVALLTRKITGKIGGRTMWLFKKKNAKRMTAARHHRTLWNKPPKTLLPLSHKAMLTVTMYGNI